MFLHGISSPLIFAIVSETYALTRTRQFNLIRGVSYVRPLLGFIATTGFFYNLPAPPIPRFLAEVEMFFCYTNRIEL
jgi:NADH:ubiquinone oxidoreductase subunit 4 (subunit M)